MSRYPGPGSVPPGQPLPSVGGYPPPGMPGHMPSPQTVPPYSVAVASPSQYVQQPASGPSPTPTHYGHPPSQPTMINAPAGYGQQMMHGGMLPSQVGMTQPIQAPPSVPQQPPPSTQQPQQQSASQPGGIQDDLGNRVRRAYGNLETNLKGFLRDYSNVLQMDDARLNSQTPETLAQESQNLVRRYETLLVSLDLFEMNLRMLQDYTSTQNDFRRLISPSSSDPRRSVPPGVDPTTHPGHPQYQGVASLGRPVDPNDHQILVNKMQSQIDAFNSLREFGKKFLENNSSNNLTTTTSGK